jgi:hypothetical protein
MLLASGMSGIRASLGQYPNPVVARHMADRAYLIADVMHNLARFAAEDFVGFDEDRYWSVAEAAGRFHPRMKGFGDRAAFERGLMPEDQDIELQATRRQLYSGRLELVRCVRDGEPD